MPKVYSLSLGYTGFVVLPVSITYTSQPYDYRRRHHHHYNFTMYQTLRFLEHQFSLDIFFFSRMTCAASCCIYKSYEPTYEPFVKYLRKRQKEKSDESSNKRKFTKFGQPEE